MNETSIQSVRARLYRDLACYLLGEGIVQYVDLWNNQWDHLDEEAVIRFPCALIEFGNIDWKQIGRHCQRAEVQISIHVGIKTKGRSSAVGKTLPPAVEYFECLVQIHRLLARLRLDYAGTFTRIASLTDHDHAELIDCIEVYRVGVIDTSAEPQTARVPAGIEIDKVSIERPAPSGKQRE